jgi:hypothetical protein
MPGKVPFTGAPGIFVVAPALENFHGSDIPGIRDVPVNGMYPIGRMVWDRDTLYLFVIQHFPQGRSNMRLRSPRAIDLILIANVFLSIRCTGKDDIIVSGPMLDISKFRIGLERPFHCRNCQKFF